MSKNVIKYILERLPHSNFFSNNLWQYRKQACDMQTGILMSKKPTVLMILDGYGLNDKSEGNAIKLAHTPVMDKLVSEYPFVNGNASGMAVGLPEGQMGNSEVGHLNMGAGRIIYQELTRITKEIQDGDFFRNKALLEAISNCKKNGSDLHLLGLLSDGGVHSHITHLFGLLELAKKEGLSNVYVHAFLDGRDTAPTSGKGFAVDLTNKMEELGVGKIASVMGRYYAMDRDNRWDRVEKAYAAMVMGEGDTAVSGVEAIQNSYNKKVNDEFVIPTVVTESGKPIATIKENDSVIFFNFRPDRAREITRAFCDDAFAGFKRDKGRMPLTYVCFSDYDITIPNKIVAFHKVSIENTFGQFLAANHMTQLRLAETEKYAHVTFFFNGGVEVPNEGEERILVKSPKVATYDLQPEMSAFDVAKNLVDAITSLKYDVIIVSFANPDMVGHTGIQSAAIKAVEAVDKCVGMAYDALLSVDGQMFICADHGNVEQLVDYNNGEPFTAHTINPVPFILVNYDKNYTLKENGCLADIAPTLIEMMGMTKPFEMTGKSLLIKK
jgi:2,3-bisphosphoglycerate-independent phosphoglycerate mutase